MLASASVNRLRITPHCIKVDPGNRARHANGRAKSGAGSAQTGPVVSVTLFVATTPRPKLDSIALVSGRQPRSTPYHDESIVQWRSNDVRHDV